MICVHVDVTLSMMYTDVTLCPCLCDTVHVVHSNVICVHVYVALSMLYTDVTLCPC